MSLFSPLIWSSQSSALFVSRDLDRRRDSARCFVGHPHPLAVGQAVCSRSDPGPGCLAGMAPWCGAESSVHHSRRHVPQTAPKDRLAEWCQPDLPAVRGTSGSREAAPVRLPTPASLPTGDSDLNPHARCGAKGCSHPSSRRVTPPHPW